MLVPRNFSDLLTHTRASNGWLYDSSGNLVVAAANLPRIDYDPATLSAIGYLFEETRTNYIRNPRCEGAVAGTPGTLPTNWAIANASALSSQVVGTGTENGIPYLDLRIFGTVSGGLFALNFEGVTTTVPASQNQSWSGAFSTRYVAGSLSNVGSVTATIVERNSSGSSVSTSGGPQPLNSTPLAQNRYSTTYALPNAAAAYVSLRYDITLTNGGAVDITLRIAAPDLQLGAFQTSIILPPAGSPAQSVRAVDAAVNTNISPWFNPSEGTFMAKFRTPIPSSVSAFCGIAGFDDGTANNRLGIVIDTAAKAINFVQVAGGVNTFSLTGAVVASLNNVNKAVIRYKNGQYAISVNGAAPVKDASAVNPPAVSNYRVGIRPVGTPATMWLQDTFYTPSAISDSAMQSLST